MSILYFDETTALFEALKRIRQDSAGETELRFAQGSVFWQSRFNKTLIFGLAKNLGKSVSLVEAQPAQAETSRFEAVVPATGTKQRPRVFPRHGWFLGLALFALVFLAGSSGFIYLYLPKAEVVLRVDEKVLESEALVKVDVEKPNLEPGSGVLPGKILEIEGEDQEVFAATGVEEQGEKAVGELNIRNWTDQELTLSAGTAVRARGGVPLEFVLEESLVVPAQKMSGERPDERTYLAGKALGRLRAHAIGDEYNLPAGTEFELEGYSFSDLPAVNETAFSQGSRRQISVVSADDQARARSRLLSKLAAQSRADLETKLLGDQKIINETIQGAMVSETFDRTVGEEAKQFYLTLKTRTSAVAYSQSQLEALLGQELQASIPEGFALSGVDRTLSVKTVSTQGEDYQLAVAIKALIVPAIDLEGLARQLAGKRLAQAQSILGQLGHLKEYQINLWPRLPSPLQVLPYRRERIKVSLEIG